MRHDTIVNNKIFTCPICNEKVDFVYRNGFCYNCMLIKINEEIEKEVEENETSYSNVRTGF